MSDFAKVGELYVPLKEALSEFDSRQKNVELKASVAEFFKGYAPPQSLRDAPGGVYAPALVTPNLELTYLLDVVDGLPIPMHYFEFAHDKFVHMNFSKRCLGHMFFFDTSDVSGKTIVGDSRILNFQLSQGKPMDEIVTLSGENFVNFHHRVLSAYLGERKPEILNFSDWFAGSAAFDPALPYLRYLGLFITDGILFANFTTEKREAAFTDERVIPAFRKLKEIFGVSPLIVPIQPTESDDELFWCYYPEEVKALC